MTIEEALVAQLLATPAVTALLGSGSSFRFYPMVIPQAATDAAKYPAAVWERISGPREHDLEGPAGLAHPRFQITCWAKTMAQAVAVSNAISVALDGFSGTLGGVGGVETSPILVEDERDAYDDDERVFARQLDIVCWHDE